MPRRSRTQKTVIATLLERSAVTSEGLDHVRPWIAAPPNHYTSAVFLDGGERQQVDLSCLKRVPHLAEFLHTGFVVWARSLNPTSRRAMAGSLARGFIAYLCESNAQTIRANEVGRDIMVGFLKWLDRRHAKNGNPWSIGTKINYLVPVKEIARATLSSPKHHDAASLILDALPSRPWPGASNKINRTQVVAMDVLVRAITHAENEVLDFERVVHKTDALLAAGRAERQAPEQRAGRLSLAACLSIIEEREVGLAIELTEFERTDRCVYAAILEYGADSIFQYLFPNPRHLVPFVLLLTTATGFNPDTVLGLNRSDIKSFSFLGADWFEVQGKKNRAASNPLISLKSGRENQFSFARMFALLETWTSRLRPHLDSSLCDRLFAYKLARRSRATSFRVPTIGGTSDFPKALDSFLGEHNIPRFTLKQIRHTLLDDVARDDLALAQALGGHRKRATTWDHYASDGPRQRQQERLGEVLMLRDRWRRTLGKIDPREFPHKNSQGAATPGFDCLDPFASPMSGQQAGRLCSAYGRCPVCPLAVSNLSDRSSVAFYEGLKSAIIAARGAVGPSSWMAQWAPVLQALNNLLACVPTNVRKAAEPLVPKLPTVG